MATVRARVFATAGAWRAWLGAHHASSSGVWLLLGGDGVTQRQAVEEALCFGWIDSQVHSNGDGTYRQRFTPRRKRSVWSAANRSRVAALTRAGRMAPAGLAAVARARADGSWNALQQAEDVDHLPRDLAAALRQSARARRAFAASSPSRKKQLLYLVTGARTDATRQKRVRLAVFMLEEGVAFDIHTRISELEARMKAQAGPPEKRAR